MPGGPGRSKSWYFNEAAAQRRTSTGNPAAHVIKGYAKPVFQVYKQLYWHMDEKIIVDDAELLDMEGSGSRDASSSGNSANSEDPYDVSLDDSREGTRCQGDPPEV